MTRKCQNITDYHIFGTSDVNKWSDVTQNLCQSSVLLTILYVKRVIFRDRIYIEDLVTTSVIMHY